MKKRIILVRSVFIIFVFCFTLSIKFNCFALDVGRVQMSVTTPEIVKAGDTVIFQILVLNEGSGSWNTGSYSINVDIYDNMKTYKASTESTSEGPAVAAGESALFFLSYGLPKVFAGQYFYKVNLKYNKKIITTSDFYNFNIVAVARNANIVFVSTIGDQKYDGNFKVICQVKNTGEVANNFPVRLELKGANTNEFIRQLKNVQVAKGEVLNLTFDCSIPISFSDGAVTAIAEVYDRIEDGNPVKKFAEATQEFRLSDMLPSVQFLNLGLSAIKGEEISLKVRVSDDKGIAGVKITCQIPGMQSKIVSDMSLLSGTKTDGVWVFKTSAFGVTGKFMFTIEATDTKSQVSKVEYQTTVVNQ